MLCRGNKRIHYCKHSYNVNTLVKYINTYSREEDLLHWMKNRYFHNIHMLAYIFIHDITKLKRLNFQHAISSLFVYEQWKCPLIKVWQFVLAYVWFFFKQTDVWVLWKRTAISENLLLQSQHHPKVSLIIL